MQTNALNSLLKNGGRGGIQPGTGSNNLDYWNDVAAKASVKLAAEKLNRMMKEAHKSIEDVRMSLMIGDKSKDRQVEQDSLKRVAQQELEMAQAMALLPYSREMYRYKVEQLNRIAEERKEMEKVLLDNMLANNPKKQKRDQDYDQRKKRIRDEIRRALGEQEDPTGEYDKKIGFDLHFDFVLDIPENHQACQMSHGIFNNGQLIVPSQLTGTHTVDGAEKGDGSSFRSLYGEKTTITGIAPDPETLIFMELQFLNKYDSVNQSRSFGWTALDVFTPSGVLKRGRFKLPFYVPPINTSINAKRISRMKPKPDGYVYVRINHPDEANNETDFNYYDDLAEMGFSVPPMHEYAEGDDGEFGDAARIADLDKRKAVEEENRRLQQIVENQKERLVELGILDDERYTNMYMGQRAIFNRLNKDPLAAPDVPLIPEKPESEEEKEEEPKKELTLVEESRLQKAPHYGLKLDIEQIQKIGDETTPVRADMSIYFGEEQIPIVDDDETNMEFAGNETEFKLPKKKKLGDAKLNDQHKIPFHFQGLFDLLKKKKRTDEPCYAVFKIFRGDNQTSWGLLDLKKKNKVNKGKHSIKLYPLPMPDLPIDSKALKKLTPLPKHVLDVKLDLEKYDRKEIEKFLGNKKKPKKKKEDKKEDDKKTKKGKKEKDKKEKDKKEKDKKEKDKKEKPKKEKEKKGRFAKNKNRKDKKRATRLTNRKRKKDSHQKKRKDQPFITNNDPVHSKDEFSNHGIDILIDQLRFMPYNATNVTVVTRVLSSDFTDLIKPKTGHCDLTSNYLMPIFQQRVELRKDVKYENDLYLMLTFFTIDYYTENPGTSIIGYSFFPFFINRNSGEPATVEDEETTLQNGPYQLRVYCQSYPKKTPLNMEKIEKLEFIPGCTCLVRVEEPLLEDDEPVGLTAGDDQEKLIEDGIWVPFKDYRLINYNTKYISKPSEYELELLKFKKKPATITKDLKSRVEVIMEAYGDGLDEELTLEEKDEEIQNFIERVS